MSSPEDPNTWRPHIVLVHGLYHGAWSWSPVIRCLGGRYPTTSVELPLTTLTEDIAVVQSVVDAAGGPVVVCGHSYAGAVITGLRADNVKHAVYIGAIVPRGDETVASIMTANAPLDWMVTSADGSSHWVDPCKAIDTLYGDCVPELAAHAVGRLRPAGIGTFLYPPGRALWSDVPTTYVVCTNGNAIGPAIQREFAQRAASVEEWAVSHSPFFSQPARVADLLERTAADAN